MAMTPSMKTALGVAILGLLLIIAAGVMTALDHVRGIGPLDCRVAQASKSATPIVLDVRSGGSGDAPVVQLGRPICVIVAGLRQPPIDAAHSDLDVSLFI